MRTFPEMIRELYEGIETHPVFVALYETMSSLLLSLKNINTQYNPLIYSTPEPTVVFREVRCEPSLSREIFMASGIVILTVVVVKHIWCSTAENDKILEDCQNEKERKHKKENSCKLRELYRILQGLKNYLSAPPEIEVSYPADKIMFNERRKGMTTRGPYSEVCKQQSSSVHQFEHDAEKYSKVKENLLKALLSLEEQMESKEMNNGDANSKNLGYWSNKEDILAKLRVLGSEEAIPEDENAEVNTGRERSWSNYANSGKEVNFKPRTVRLTDQYRQAVNREEIIEVLRALGILDSKPTSRSEVSSQQSWPKYPNSDKPQHRIEKEENVKPHMPSSTDQCKQVNRYSAVAKTEQAMVPFQEVERNGKSEAVDALAEFEGLNAGKSCCKQNEAQNSLKVSLMDMQSSSLQQKVTCDCSSLEFSSKRGKESTGLLSLTANRNTINIELLLNRNTQMS